MELFCIALAIVFILGSTDDLFLDIIHGILGIKPKVTSPAEWMRWRSLPEKPIAVMIPAWNESAVLEQMVETNLRRLHYTNYRWFIGVYPNDDETLSIVRKLERIYPEKITVVVTDRPGPTSKAHCLNCILSTITNHIKTSRWVPHYAVIHDAEDVIHPDSFIAISAMNEEVDFIQIPILSLPVSIHKWVAGTYLDEFAEIHMKELPVRQALGMPVPSAGVGTFFSWRILEKMGPRFGYWFDEGNLTEDYEISLRIARMGGKQRFLFMLAPGGELLSTREYFPSELGRSVRQKTRWTIGIGLQTAARWGNYGVFTKFPGLKDFIMAYALWRDRKALWANPSVLVSWGLSLSLLGLMLLNFYQVQSLQYPEVMASIFVINLTLLSIRVIQRARFTSMVYGRMHGLMSIPRVLVSGWINGVACLQGLKTFFLAQQSRRESKIEWAKTHHEFPTAEVLGLTVHTNQLSTAPTESERKNIA